MKLSDIRTGHVVEFGNGERMVAVTNTATEEDVFKNERTYVRFDSYNVDLSHKREDSNWDIVKIFNPDFSRTVISLSTAQHTSLIWDRYPTLDLEVGDVLISKDLHSCKVKFVEDVNENHILLVDGVKDVPYDKEEFYLIAQQYEILCKAEDRRDV